ncbi:AAA family ATPase [Nonomuraea sp. NPDC049695]|uniref:nSTAND1 domain-containing NTPase n=1 Tax=Nonomuraea sp. NPDC049695 TaxID=3154734 RepID=UPI00341F59A9
MAEQEDPRTRLARRLAQLLDLADLPLDRIAARATARRAPGQTWTVRAQRISDWKTGEHLPKSDQAFAAVIRILIEACRTKAAVLPAEGTRELLDERAWTRLLREARAAPARTAVQSPPQWSGGCPYRGLAPFGKGDSAVFYGRDRLTTKLIAALRARLDRADLPGMLIVSGASGAGKSSLLQAGLLPSLHLLDMGAQHWPVVTIQPTDAPLDELARRLAAEAGTDPAVARRELRDDPRNALALVRDVLAAHARSAAPDGHERETSRLILIVDPFEEIFAPAEGAARQRHALITALHTMAGGSGGTSDAAVSGPRSAASAPALVIAVIRSDFLTACTAYDELEAALGQDLLMVGPMSETELRLAITGPAEQAGIHVAPELVNIIVNDLRASPEDDTFQVGALPLLSEAMRVTWTHREGDRLTTRGYERAGGVARAIQLSAESVYASLGGRRQKLARQVFHRLTQVTVNGAVRRRPMPYRRTGQDQSGRSDLEAVVESFAAERLVVVEGDTVQITHDALLHAWDRLAGWLKEDPAHRALYERLLDDAEEWQRQERDRSLLYHGFRLDAVRQVLSYWRADPERYPELQALPRAFLDNATVAEKRRGRLRRAAVSTLAGLFVIALVAAVAAVRAGRESAQQQTQTLSRLLAVRSESVGESDPMVSALLAASAWRVAPTGDARRSLLSVLNSPYHGSIPGSAVDVACNADGRTLATVGRDNMLRLWDAPTRRPQGGAVPFSREESFSVAFSPDGKILAAGGKDGMVRLWDVATRRPLHDPLTGHKAIIRDLAFSHDGATLATASDDGTVRLWDVPGGRPKGGPLTGHRGIVSAVAFSNDGRTLASGGVDRTVRLWDTRTRRPRGEPLTGHELGVATLAFSPDGKTLASGSGDRTVRLWDVARGRPDGPPIPDGQAIYTVAFSQDGTALAVGGDESIVRLWQPSTRRPLGTPLTGFSEGIVWSMCFGADGSYLAAAGQGHAVRLWRMGSRFPQGRTLIDNPPDRRFDSLIGGSSLTYRPRFSQDGRLLASAGLDSRMRLWDVASRRPIGDPWPERVEDVAFHPGGKIVGTWNVDSGVQLFDLASHRPLGPPLPCRTPAGAPAFSPDGTTVAVACRGNPGYAHSVRFWDVRTGRETGTPIHVFYEGVAFSPDGSVMAAFGAGVQLWDLRHRTLVVDLPSRAVEDVIEAVSFSPDGRVLTLMWNDRVQQVNVAEGETVAPPFTFGAETTAMALTADGSVAVVRNPDDTVSLWETTSQRPLSGSLPAQANGVVGAAVSPDGRTLATMGKGAVVLRDVDLPADPVAAVCALVERKFTEREWQGYAPGAPYVAACPG